MNFLNALFILSITFLLNAVSWLTAVYTDLRSWQNPFLSDTYMKFFNEVDNVYLDRLIQLPESPLFLTIMYKIIIQYKKST